MQNWDEYRLILALYRGKTLRNAAQTLGVNHTTVARRLAALHKRFGAEVVEPSPQGYQLTAVGKSLLSSALQIEDIVSKDSRLERAQQLALSGEINLSVPAPILQFLLMEELQEFQQANPGLKLNIHTSFELADLDRCEADVVVRSSNTPDEHLVGYKLFPISVSYYAAQDYLASTSPENYRWITNVFSGERPDWIQRSPYPDAPIGLCISDLTLRHKAASQGYGLIRGACYVAEQFKNLKRLDNCVPYAFQDLWVLSHPDLAKIKRIQVLKHYLMEVLRDKKDRIVGTNQTHN